MGFELLGHCTLKGEKLNLFWRQKSVVWSLSVTSSPARLLCTPFSPHLWKHSCTFCFKQNHKQGCWKKKTLLPFPIMMCVVFDQPQLWLSRLLLWCVNSSSRRRATVMTFGKGSSKSNCWTNIMEVWEIYSKMFDWPWHERYRRCEGFLAHFILKNKP